MTIRVIASFLLLCVLLVQTKPVAARQFKLALPGYSWRFPVDHASHDEYKTEWWYYTGHLRADDGSRYGYELTFFRSALDVPEPIKQSVWSVDNAYLAHFAVTDLSARKFFYTSKLNRAGVGFAGADQKNYYVWNQNWRAALLKDGSHKLNAASGDFKLDLSLVPVKEPVLHGERGHSQKASCHGCASYYYSLTRMRTTGTLTHAGKVLHVSGASWMDHEFGSNQLTAEQVGWDWFSLQLDDNTELMLYLMRRRDGTLDPNSSGTYVTADGASRHLKLSDYKVVAFDKWRSPATGAVYPMGWRVEIPSFSIKLEITPELKEQELAKRRDTDVTYWEGASAVRGRKDGKPITGQAYVEMTGYGEHFKSRI